MRKIFYFILFLVPACFQVQAQHAIFIAEGKIEFTRTVNLYARMTTDDDSWRDLQKKAMPKFKTSYFDLYFSHNRWKYQPGRENPDNNRLWTQDVAETNIISTDYATGKATSQKDIFGESFLIQDSMRRIRWKLTDETRMIAGFTCHRANALIMDSIYVVAFYTDEILTPGGPESFCGLPGMILGVSLPHQHMSWFASKVEGTPITKNQMQPPVKGKKCTKEAFRKTLNDGLKEWGKYGRKYMEDALL
jgi:GLPGLI family protein